ncbi:hypothetical protein, partial [Zooshikella harenae]
SSGEVADGNDGFGSSGEVDAGDTSGGFGNSGEVDAGDSSGGFGAGNTWTPPNSNTSETENVDPRKLLGLGDKAVHPREHLNDKVRLGKYVPPNTKKNHLTKAEKRKADQILNDLEKMRQGDLSVRAKIEDASGSLRYHKLEDELSDYASLDLSSTMRLIYKETSNGIEWFIQQQH